MYSVNVSEIQFMPGLECEEQQDFISDELLVNNVLKNKMVLQIVSVSGTLFALNSSLLLLYRELARRGQVTRIRAERVSVDKIPATLLSRPRHPRTSCSGLGRAGARRLHSISACVTLQETETAGDSSRGHLQALLQEEEEEDGYYEDSEADTEDDSAEESECAVCNLMFVGETRLEQHCRVAHHWGCHLLNLHREAASHWTDDEYEHNSEADEEEAEYNMEGWEELERLL